MSDKLEDYREKVANTNIDQRSLLSTDYFNTFNSVIMLLDLLPDAPELLEEVEQWQFLDYIGHFKVSSLDFADLAIEVYDYAPADLRDAFEHKINSMRVLMEEVTRTLRRLRDAGETRAFAIFAQVSASSLRAMTEEGAAIVHGSAKTLDQSAIDALF